MGRNRKGYIDNNCTVYDFEGELRSQTHERRPPEHRGAAGADEKVEKASHAQEGRENDCANG